MNIKFSYIIICTVAVLAFAFLLRDLHQMKSDIETLSAQVAALAASKGGQQ